MSQDLAVFDYKVLFLSDLHMGSGKTATPYLYEFLKHQDFTQLREIYLVGDVIGGWEHQNRRQQPFAEMEKRVLDIINYAAANGVRVHLMPGNHDEKLRPEIEQMAARKSFKTFPENVIFEQDSYYETEGPDKKRLKIVHGDQHDPDLFVKPWFRPITFMTSAFYDAMVHVDFHISQALYKHLGVHISFAKGIKNAFKKVIGFCFSHNSLLKGLENKNFDGILMGHTHMAGTQVFDDKGKKSYLINDGDWVESSTVAVVSDLTQLPRVLHYKAERERLGFGDLPDETDAHPAQFQAFRAQTDRQVRLIQNFWPAKDRAKHLKAYALAEEKMNSYKADRQNLLNILDQLDITGRLDNAARGTLSKVTENTRRASYRLQKKGLKTIFNKYAKDAVLEKDDLIYSRTVVREFATRAERKIRKHMERLDKSAAILDYKPAT